MSKLTPKQTPTTAKPSKRDALVVAAKTLLWERGFEAMSPKAVLQLSGAGQGSFYHHFKGKRDLAATALAAIDRELRDDLAKRLHDDLSALEKIEAYLNAPRHALKGCRLGRLANEQAIFDPVLGPIVLSFMCHVETQLGAAIKKAKKDGALPKALKPKETARMLMALVQGGYALSRIHQDANYLKDATRGARTMLRVLAKTHSCQNPRVTAQG